MSLSPSSLITSWPCSNPSVSTKKGSISYNRGATSLAIRCESNEQSSSEKTGKEEPAKLGIGSPVIVTEASKMVKTAASVPCLRVNSRFINAGDVGRLVSRKPKDVWAVRLSAGTYLIDGKYFKPLELDD